MWLESRQTVLARGIIAVAFGTLLMLFPGISVAAFVLVFGAFAVLDGVLFLSTAAVAPRRQPGRTLALVAGLLAIVVGVITFAWPGLTELALVVLVAVRALVIGSVEIAACVHAWRDGAPRSVWVLGWIGAISVAFGAFLLAFPRTGLLALVWAIGLYAILAGVLTIVHAWMDSRLIASSIRGAQR
jgi:uncharacterized membrane protein HdeD (DUF308 family)